jgi:hypothetical protein
MALQAPGNRFLKSALCGFFDDLIMRRIRCGLVLILSIACCLHHGAAQSFTGGFNFALPAIDTFSVRFLPAFPRHPIGSQEFVTVGTGGHFSVNGTPVRFFGTNCVADGAFPSPQDVWFIAGRLRKMALVTRKRVSAIRRTT